MEHIEPATSNGEAHLTSSAIDESVPHEHSRLTSLYHEESTKIAQSSDDQVFHASVKAGLTDSPASFLSSAEKTVRVQDEKLRDHLADFNAFTQSIKVPPKVLGLGDGLPKENKSELWVGQEKVRINKRKKSKSLRGDDDDGVIDYNWVLWKDHAGIVRTAMTPSGTSIVGNFRALKWPKRLQRFLALSFCGRDAHKPFERDLYTRILSEPIAGHKNPDNTVFKKSSALLEPKALNAPLRAITKSFVGLKQNSECTILRSETVEALRLYCNHDYTGFLSALKKYGTIITYDIITNINRGPIFSPGMVSEALRCLMQDSLQEFIPQETLLWVKDVLFHYLANRDLRPGRSISSLSILARWKSKPFGTSGFAASEHVSEEFSDSFYTECQSLIYQGLGDTEGERIKSGAAISAVLFTACLAAMAVADKDNAAYAASTVTIVTLALEAAGALFGVARFL